MHLKRIAMPKSWPIQRKANKFIIGIRGPHSKKLSLPLLVVLRDMLKLVRNAKEAKKVLQEGNVLVDNRIIKDMKFSIGLFDRIYIKKIDASFSMYLTKKGKLVVERIDKGRLYTKPSKIINKRVLKRNKMQINLWDGRNFLVSDKKFSTGDSIIIDLKNKKIKDCLKLCDGAYVLIMGGRHKGSSGKVTKVIEEKKEVEILVDKNTFRVSKENIFIVDKNEFEKQARE